MATPKSFEGLGALIEQEIAHMPPNHTHHAVHPGNLALQNAQSAAQQALTKDWRRVDAIAPEPGAVMRLPEPARPSAGWAALTDYPQMKFDPTTGKVSPFKAEPPTVIGWRGLCGHTWNVLNIDWSQRKPPECPTCATTARRSDALALALQESKLHVMAAQAEAWGRPFAPPGASLYGTQPGDESEAEAIDAAMGDALSTGTGFIQAGRDGTHHVPSVWRLSLPSWGPGWHERDAQQQPYRDAWKIKAEAALAHDPLQRRCGCVSDPCVCLVPSEMWRKLAGKQAEGITALEAERDAAYAMRNESMAALNAMKTERDKALTQVKEADEVKRWLLGALVEAIHGRVTAATMEDAMILSDMAALGWTYSPTEDVWVAVERRDGAGEQPGNHPYHGPTAPHDIKDEGGNVVRTERRAVPDVVHERFHGAVGDVLSGNVMPEARKQMQDALNHAPKHKENPGTSTDAPMPGKALKLTHAEVGLKLP